VRVAAFTKYGREAASTRQRLLQYLPSLAAAGIEIDYSPLLGDDYVRSLASGGSFSKLAVARSYARRLKQLLRGPNCDLLWVYAELFPYWPAAFERLAFRAGKPVVYDFDDAFFLTYEGKRLLSGKLEPLIAGAAACCCGNDYLRDYALRLNPRSMVLPTVVDTQIYVPMKKAADGPVAIGWIGSPTTWQYVRPLLPLLAELCDGERARLLVVGAGAAATGDQFPGMELAQWSEAGEVASVQAMDIGIMPLPDEPWARGKSGYKLIQYMACGLPVVASPVGVNSSIVCDGETGFLASTVEEWRARLEALIVDPDARQLMGAAGRQRAVEAYSLRSQAPRLIEVLRLSRDEAGVSPGL
jgi:glycosyltransferase involved in cell wall biosynthesis